MSSSAQAGAKRRDYFWTVLVVDPLAFPLVRLLARTRWLSPNGVTWVSFVLGALTGPAFAIATWPTLAAGGVLYYLSFVCDCVDGKLARSLGVSSPSGAHLEEVADGARRLSAALGLVVYLLRTDAGSGAVIVAVAYALTAAYFTQIWGGGRSSTAEVPPRGRIDSALARHRLLPTVGMPDVSAIVFVIGPVTKQVVPALIVGIVLVALAVARVIVRLATSPDASTSATQRSNRTTRGSKTS